MRRLIAVAAFLGLFGAVCVAEAANELLFNGNLDLTVGSVYYDGFDPSLADDVPGWDLFLGAADGSYVLVSPDVTPGAGSHDADMGIGPSGGGMRTAPGSRASVAAGSQYHASVTYDNYFNAVNPSYFIDWFEGDGDPLGSSGGVLGDPNGPFGYAPYTQKFTVSAVAPAGAELAGVRFLGGNPGYNGLAADHFSLVPEPGTASLLILAAAGLLASARRSR